MKTLDRITLVTTGVATLVAATYLTQKIIKARIERIYRAAAGESRYERKHSKMYRAHHA
jgi:hypothetical protein